MHHPWGARLHYRCAFDIEARRKADRNWGDLIRTVRGWVAKKTGTTELPRRSQFYTGGQWTNLPGKRTSLRVEVVAGEGTDQQPQYWAMNLEHPCSEVAVRRWQVDIGVTSRGDRTYHLVLAVSHRLKEAYLGEEPALPTPSAPKLVQDLIDSRGWIVTSGSVSLASRPTYLRIGDGPRIRDLIINPERCCPLAYLSHNAEIGKPLLDAERLARLLTGTALVIVATSADIDAEIGYFLGEHLSATGGTVRVYQLLPSASALENGRRHRYFTVQDIERLTPPVDRGWPLRWPPAYCPHELACPSSASCA